jgi:hypothetical protein
MRAVELANMLAGTGIDLDDRHRSPPFRHRNAARSHCGASDRSKPRRRCAFRRSVPSVPARELATTANRHETAPAVARPA